MGVNDDNKGVLFLNIIDLETNFNQFISLPILNAREFMR